MQCPQCSAPINVGPSGENPGCDYCGLGKARTVDAGTLAASIQKHMTDAPSFANALAQMLEHAFPMYTRVERKGFFTKTIATIQVEVKAELYTLVLDGTRAFTSRMHVVRGVKLKDEQLAIGPWVTDLSRSLARIAEENAQSAEMVQRFLQ